MYIICPNYSFLYISDLFMEGAKFSLSFSKKIEKKVLQPSALRVAPIKEGEAKRKAIESIEGNLIER